MKERERAHTYNTATSTSNSVAPLAYWIYTEGCLAAKLHRGGVGDLTTSVGHAEIKDHLHSQRTSEITSVGLAHRSKGQAFL